MSTLDALRRGVDNYPGGREVVAVRIGKTGEVLRKELSGAASHKLGAVDALTIARIACEEGRPTAMTMPPWWLRSAAGASRS